MSTKAVSLLGFLPEAAGMGYLRANCVLTRTSTNAIREQWMAARARVRVPMPKAGQPEVLDIPPGYDDYLTGVQANPAFGETVKGMDWSFKLIEIDPLIAFQIQVELERSANLCSNVSEAVPFIGDMLGPCLPLDVEDIPTSVGISGNSLTVQAPSMNLKFRPPDSSGAPQLAEITVPNSRRVRTVGVQFLPSSPLTQVVRFRDRTYLKNGYHRAYGFGKAGATHIPCVYLEGNTTFAEIGLVPNATFQPDLLESPTPPTMGHFVQDRGVVIDLVARRPVLRINWSYRLAS